MAAHASDCGNTVARGVQVTRLRREGRRVRSAISVDQNGARQEWEGRFFLSSAPLTEIVAAMDPAPPPEVLSAALALRYRNHVGVDLLVSGNPFPDNWIYVHDRRVRMARIANYSNFSPAMSATPGVCPLTIEYFTFAGDSVWEAADSSLIELATDELVKTKILKREQVLDGFVVRNEKAYPVIETGYERHLTVIKEWLDGFDNLLPIGRSGMFKYNNQDHAMATGLLAARTALGIKRYDPWLVNIDAEYHESGRALERPLGAASLGPASNAETA